MIMDAPVLKYYQAGQPLTHQYDASEKGLGVVILQEQPIVYVNRALTETEQGYVQTETELLDGVFRVEQFHQHIYGHPVILQTTNL